jgi:hypothetical protein
MQFFELLVIFLGIANGAILPLLPDARGKEKPIGAILGLSLAFALLTVFMPVIASSPRFLSTLGITFAGAVAGYFAMRAGKETTQSVGAKTTTVHHAA